MAGDWIKLRTNLHGDPAVIAMARALREDAFTIVGRLHALWAWADQHTDDGQLPYTVLDDINDVVKKRGFAEQMVRVGWLQHRPDEPGVTIPLWDRHNGRSAKKRCLDSEAQRRKRETNPDINRTMSETVSDKKRQPPDQRREEKSNTPVVPKGDSEPDLDFVEFWQAYPNKAKRKDAARAWRQVTAQRPPLPDLLAALDDFKSTPQWVRDAGAFIPHASTWLRGQRWTEVQPSSSASENSEKKERGAPPDELWRAYLAAEYPDADPGVYATWSQVPDSLRAEILEALALAEKEAA